MSVISVIEGDAKTFGSWAEKELEKVFKTAPAIAAVTDTVIDYLGPVLEDIVTAEYGGPAGALVTEVVNEVQQDLIVVGGLVYDLGASPTVAGKVAAMQTDLNGLLAAGHIKNPATVKLVGLALRELGGLVTKLTPPPTATPTATTTAAPTAE